MNFISWESAYYWHEQNVKIKILKKSGAQLERVEHQKFSIVSGVVERRSGTAG